MNYKVIRLEFISVIVWQQIAGNNSLRNFLVGNACGDNGIFWQLLTEKSGHLVESNSPGIKERSPGLSQHVLTVLVSGPGFCSCPSFHLGLGASDRFPGLAFCFTGPWTLLGSAARSSPTTRAKTGRTTHVFTAQGDTIAVLIHNLRRSPVNFPQENKVFQRPCRSVLLPSYFFVATTVVN